MIKAECNKGAVKLDMSGNIPEIGADVLTLLIAMYQSIFDDDIIKAMIFRQMLEDNFSKIFVVEKENDNEKYVEENNEDE